MSHIPYIFYLSLVAEQDFSPPEQVWRFAKSLCSVAGQQLSVLEERWQVDTVVIVSHTVS